MNKLKYTINGMLLALIFLSACKEIEQPVILSPFQVALKDTTYVSATPINTAEKRVLIEEFSGVRCKNCPNGGEKVKELLAEHPERLVASTVHNDFLARPYPDNPDLRCEDANLLANHFVVGGKPITLIDRKKFGGSNSFVVSGAGASLNLWNNYVNDQLALPTKVDVQLEIVSADLEERKFRYSLSLKFTQAMTNVNLGFFLTESDIKATQLFPDNSKDKNYKHKHVLRTFIGSFLGEQLTENIVANTIIIKEFEIDLDDTDYNPAKDWKMENMELVAFIRTANENIENVAKAEL